MANPNDRVAVVHDNFLRRVAAGDFPQGSPPAGPLDDITAVQIYRSACLTRALDRESRRMQAAGQGYYTIGPSGHEGMAALAAALDPADTAFLHYRDAAFQIQRAEQAAILAGNRPPPRAAGNCRGRRRRGRWG